MKEIFPKNWGKIEDTHTLDLIKNRELARYFRGCPRFSDRDLKQFKIILSQLKFKLLPIARLRQAVD
ncbi:MAG TPA: hypothetical protein DCM64_02435 [Gammaproteobacteria bacterium]|nr:hypothetical protein [Gammaproteobacteria bacterium]